mgnify:CR=1 FL=1
MNNTPYINACWVKPSSEQTLTCINPATEEVIAEIHTAGPVEIDQAIAAAKNAFESWGKTTGAERAVFLRAIADVMEQSKQKLTQLSSANNGKPLAEAEFDLDDAIASYRYYADKAIELDQKQESDVPLAAEGVSSYVRFEPVGIAALIVPWNFPLVTSAWKIAPALAAGCCVVLKPAEPTALIELELGQIADQVKLPAGVLNIVPGVGALVGDYLTQHPDIDKISFTGSNRVGEMVMRSAAPLSKNVSLELGGKSPILVFDDADLEQAVEAVVAGIFFNCGQMCSATSRLIVQQGIEQEFMAKLRAAVEQIVIGPGNDDSTNMGPVTTQVQYNTVMQYFDLAKEESLDLVCGGTRAEGFDKGLFIAPTIYQNVPSDSRLWREEIFGPVLCVQSFASEEEAIAKGNDSEYGLAATVVSSDKARLRRVSAALKAGHIWWNMPQIVPVETSWGGFKQSGLGRELGPWGLSAYLEIKHIDYEA